MTVISFPAQATQRAGSWDSGEIEQLVGIFNLYAAEGLATEWSFGATEVGDPQFYVVGPAPECDSVLSVSRIGGLYVLEDGMGRVLRDDASLKVITATAEARLRPRRVGPVGRVVFGIGALRVAVQERIEPLIVESEELFVRTAPQLAAFV